MSDLKEVARLALAAKLIADFGKTETSSAKEEAAELMRAVGADRLRITSDDNAELGTLSFTRPQATARISDLEAFTEWVGQRHPERVKKIQTTVIDAEWLERILNAARQLGDPVDGETGEIMPGVVVETGAPYLTVRATAEAKDRMAFLLARSGALSLDPPSTPIEEL